MKRITLSLSLVIFAGLTTLARDWGLQGAGTQSDPYQISSAADFGKIASAISKDNTGEGEYFKVMNDIDFQGSESNPVQLPAIAKSAITNVTTVAWGFEGTLDGDNHEIKGIYHTENKNDANGQFNALFSSLGENGVIKNLIFGSDNYVDSYNYVAPFASLSKGIIENCTNNSAINATNAFASGICGQMLAGNGTIKNCVNNGNINAMTYAVGIVAGTQSGAAVTAYGYLVEGCTNYGTMTATNDVGVAGIAGSYSGSLIDCKNYGEILGVANGKTTAQYAAGIVASVAYPVEISGCENHGTVAGNKNVAGVLATVMAGDKSAFTLTDCKNYGEVSAQGDNVAGIVANTMRGSIDEPLVTVADCYNGGSVSSSVQTALIGNIRGIGAIALGTGNTIEAGLTRFELDGDAGIASIADAIANDNTNTTKSGKYIIDGQVMIIVNGNIYNLQGVEKNR